MITFTHETTSGFLFKRPLVRFRIEPLIQVHVNKSPKKDTYFFIETFDM